MTLKVNIIGAGNLGRSIGHLLIKNKLAKIVGVINTDIKKAAEAIHFMGEGSYYPHPQSLPFADIYFITTPDDHIRETSILLSQSNVYSSGAIFVHCSGVLTSEVLSAVKEKGGFVASIHPMRSFANPQTAVDNYSGTYCAAEGDSEALATLKPLFEQFGSIVYTVDSQKKALYHAAGVFAANYLITLAHQANQCLQSTGIKEPLSLKIILNLMKGTLTNIETSLDLPEALTGPLKRGDIFTVENHLAAFSNDKMRHLYSTLGIATLDLIDDDQTRKEALLKSLNKVLA